MIGKANAVPAGTGHWPPDYQAAVQRISTLKLDQAVLRVGGRDRVAWLHKLITAGVEDLAAGQGRRSALLDAKGHFQADFIVLALPDSLLIVTDGSQRASLFAALRRYVIREKVTVADETEDWREHAFIGPGAGEYLGTALHAPIPADLHSSSPAASAGDDSLIVRSRRARVESFDLLVHAQAAIGTTLSIEDFPELGAETEDVLRLEAGIPRLGKDFDTGTLALEIPPFLSIRVDQGCYVGQEVVARLVHRGHVNRMLVGLRSDSQSGLREGETLLHAETNVGRITSAANSPAMGPIALGYVRRELAQPGTELHTESRTRVMVADLPFQS